MGKLEEASVLARFCATEAATGAEYKQTQPVLTGTGLKARPEAVTSEPVRPSILFVALDDIAANGF
jgi:hypothetical protein